MKKIILIISLLLCSFVILFVQFGRRSNSYDIEQIYRVQKAERGTMVITRRGNIKEIQKILVPINFDKGKYRVSVTRRDSDLFEVIGQDIFVKTRYCYKFAYNQEVILEISSISGYSIGEIHF